MVKHGKLFSYDAPPIIGHYLEMNHGDSMYAIGMNPPKVASIKKNSSTVLTIFPFHGLNVIISLYSYPFRS